ncbi:DUF1097 domain-containing protein [Candidatus Saccharibacteria bacterium]|nr:DUF1097 domain-containing protein [Candidatus Saccharibacteria bacterium]
MSTNRFVLKSAMPVTVGLLAGALLVVDHFLAPAFLAGGNFIWVAFVSWTVFFASVKIERLKAIPSYVVGFLAANLIVWLGANLGLPWVIPGLIAIALVNFLVMYLIDIKFLVISGIFVGMAMSFALGAVGLAMWSWSVLLLILAYGALGLLCGYVCMKTSAAVEKRKTPTKR